MVQEENERPKSRWIAKSLRIVVRWSIFSALAIAAVLLIGLIPVNRKFVPPQEGIEIFLVSNEVHADVIVPRIHTNHNWDESLRGIKTLGDVSNMSHVAIGWGDKGFFLETKTWDDLKLSTVANALLLPSQTCLHVAYVTPDRFPNSKSVTINEQQYKDLVTYVNRSFQRDEDGEIVQIDDYFYSSNDAFFEAHGRYHFFNTCNSWVGGALKESGVKTPWLAPLPHTPMMYIPENEN